MPILDPQQLTGRARTHVQEFAEQRCTLQPPAAHAFLAMRAAAAAEGIDLAVSSSFRDFERQRSIWNAKYHGQRPLLNRAGQALDVARMSPERIVESILYWSALPGASRHHWGTEIDVFDRAALADGAQPQLQPTEYLDGGVFEPLARWLARNCQGFGFFLPYDLDRGGVQPEPWHLSYAPLSADLVEELTIDILAAALRDADLAGAEVVWRQIGQIHERYVRAVAQPGERALNATPLSPAATPS